MVGCCILGCKSRSERKIEGITFHNFPHDDAEKRKWIEVTGRVNWQPTKYSKIRSEHFSLDSFVKTKKATHLKPFSFPNKLVHVVRTELMNETIQNRNITESNLQYNITQNNQEDTHILQQPICSQNIIECGTSMTSQSKDTTLQNKQAKRPYENIGPITVSQNILQDIQNIPCKRLRLASDDTAVVKRLLAREKAKSSQRLKKIRALREYKRRSTKKVAHLQNIIADLKSRISDEELELLKTIDTKDENFLKYIPNKKGFPRKYSESLRKFALSLHFLSPKAYNYVRDKFKTSLPHPKTLYRWCTSINCEPGFTDESFKAIKLISQKSQRKILCSICLDEMSIRQHLQWDGKQAVGYINIAENFDSDNLPLAKDALVFMVTAVNDYWKLPVGYFLTAGVNGTQRSVLLRNCINLLLECNVEIISVTFDGYPANFAMAKILGARIDNDIIKSEICVAGQSIVVIPDACHMLKLVRNTLADKKKIINCNNETISWEYIEKLNILQENEGLHLANKLRRRHVEHKKQIMKVHLAAQTFSKSVADALTFCMNDLNMDDFHNSGATIEFINYFNDIFDIFNSRRLTTYSFKQPLSKNNFNLINSKLSNFEAFVKSLKFSDGEMVLKSGRKTGFLGFLICIKSIRVIYNKYINIQNAPLQYICTYKMSQDHLEFFFSAIRSKGGFNNNPTALQFKSAYRRLLIHGEIKKLASGNCIPLESINILKLNKNSLCRKFNSRKEILLSMEADNLDEDDLKIVDVPDTHDYIGNNQMTEYTREVTIYIAGYIIMKMFRLIKCTECLTALTSNYKFSSFISRKDVGGLHYPAEDVIKVCLYAEKILRNAVNTHGLSYFSTKNCMPNLICTIFNHFISTNLFDNLKEHIKQQNPLDNHITLLIKAICLRYLEVRIHFLMKNIQAQEKIRTYYNKIILFKGQ